MGCCVRGLVYSRRRTFIGASLGQGLIDGRFDLGLLYFGDVNGRSHALEMLAVDYVTIASYGNEDVTDRGSLRHWHALVLQGPAKQVALSGIQ